MYAWLIVFNLVVLAKTNEIDHFEDSKRRLIRDLKVAHNPELAPYNSTAPVTVNAKLTYSKLIDLNANEQTLNFIIELFLSWHDKTLAWNPENYSQITHMVMPRTAVWFPDLYMANAKQLTDAMPVYKQFVGVENDGTIQYDLPMIAVLICPLDVQMFPFDKQVCDITICSNSLSISELLIHVEVVANATTMGNGEWTVTNLTAEMEILKILNYSYQNVHYRVQLQRRPTFYIAVIIVPTFVLATVPLSLATMMSMTVLLSIASSSLPRNMMPILAYYILGEVLVCGVAAFVSVVIAGFRGRYLFIGKVDSGSPSTKPQHPGTEAQKPNDPVTKFSDRIEQILLKHEKHLQKKEDRQSKVEQWNRKAFCISFILMILFESANMAMLIIVLSFWK